MDKNNNVNPKVSRTLKKLTAKLRKAIKKNRMTVRFMFKAMDTDGNGLLSAEELRVGLQPYVPNAELDVGVMEEIIGYVDKDGDNEVTFDEFDLALKALDDQRKDRVEKRAEKKGKTNVGFPKNVMTHGSKIARKVNLSGLAPGKKKKGAMDKLEGKGSGGRVIMNDDPTAFWLDKKKVMEGAPNLTKRPKRKSPKRNEGAKTPSYKYRSPSKSIYPKLYKSKSREKTKQYEPESEQTSVNILGRIDAQNQPKFPTTIGAIESEGMETLLRQMSANRSQTIPSMQRTNTGGSSKTSYSSYGTPAAFTLNTRSKRETITKNNDMPMKTMAESWNNTWNTYTAIKVDNPLITMRKKNKKKKRKLTEIEKLQIIAEKLYNFEEEQHAEEMNTSLENMFAFSFKSNPIAQNARPITTHDGAVQLHVASEWKKGQVGAMVLLKRFRRSALLRDKIVRDKLMTECKSLRNAQNISSSVFVQKLRAVLTSPKEVVLVLQSAPGGNLKDLIQLRGKSGTFPAKHVRFYTAEILTGIHHLHKRGIIHRDLKLENILLTSKGHILISGLELSLPRHTGIANEVVGTPQYLAPEMIKGECYGRTIDYWAVGVMMYEMLCGKTPFNGENATELFSAIINDTVEMPQLMNFSEATKSCCKGLLAKEPKRRLGHNSEGGPRGLQGHEFFNSIDWKLLKKAQFPPPFLLANYTQTKDATEAYTTARQLGFGVSELGQVRSGIQFQKTHTPQSMEGSLLSVPNSFNMSEQVLRQGGGVIASSGGSGGNNTYSGINIRGNTGNRTANYTGGSSEWDPSILPSLPSTAQTSERVYTASSMGMMHLDNSANDMIEIPRFSWSDATREYREDEHRRNQIESRLSEASYRPSTRERAIPYQLQLAQIQTDRLKYNIEEQKASIKYNNAITDLAVEQGKRQVSSELKKRVQLENW